MMQQYSYLLRDFSAVILAGGKNRRFSGKIKPLIPFRNKKILEHQLNVLIPLFHEILLITNNPEHFGGFESFRIYEDLIPGKGPLSGIHSALYHARNENVFIIAGDMPLINMHTIDKQIKISENFSNKTIIPEIKGNLEPLHGIYRKKDLSRLEGMLKSENIPAVKKFLGIIHTHYWKIHEQYPFININTPEELKRYENCNHYPD